MAFQNFIPSVWDESILRELERKCVFIEDCNRKYEGKVKKMGESVTILGVGRPTIHTLASSTATIEDAEIIEDTSVIMPINQKKYYHYQVPDIDKAQAVEGLMQSFQQETAEAMANVIDRYVSSKVADATKVYSADTKIGAAAAEGTTAVLAALDLAQQKLFENDVASSTAVIITVSPRFFTLFRQAFGDKDTDNSALLKNGVVGRYNGMTIKLSNNVYTSGSGASNGLGGAVDNIMVRTQRAVAFAQPFMESEAMRSSTSFSDLIRGLTLFDAKIVRPKEILNLNVKYA